MTSSYAVSLAQPEDFKQIAHFINANFFLDVPLIRMFGMDQVPPVLARKESPDKNTAFIIKATSAEGDIVGVAVNLSKSEEWPITETTDIKTVQFIEFMKFIDEDAKLSSLPEKTVELYILSVASNWRRKGIARKLGETSLETAKQRGFEMMKICCANEFTANISIKLGFRQLYKFAYKDYPKVSGKNVVLRELPPHNYMYYYVKNLI